MIIQQLERPFICGTIYVNDHISYPLTQEYPKCYNCGERDLCCEVMYDARS